MPLLAFVVRSAGAAPRALALSACLPRPQPPCISCLVQMLGRKCPVQICHYIRTARAWPVLGQESSFSAAKLPRDGYPNAVALSRGVKVV